MRQRPQVHGALLLSAAIAVLVAGCSSGPPPADPTVVPAPAGGLSVEEYSGVFSRVAPLDRAHAVLRAAAGGAAALLDRRLGIRPDPDRPRLLALSDDVEAISVESRFLNGRRVQFISIPAAAIAQRRRSAGDLVAEAFATAVLSDPEWTRLPAWFGAGAPTWLAGALERRIYERALAPGAAGAGVDALLPALDPLSGPADPVSSAAFFRFLAEEFGAVRLPGLAAALAGAGSAEDGLAAALGTDPASLGVAFDGFRVRTAADLLGDPVLRELRSAAGEDPEGRIRRLSGLAAQAGNGFVAAATLEALGRAQYEAGDYEGAADTFARVEREYVAYALDLAGDRYRFALCFARTGQPEAAVLRLATFLEEFPSSDLAPDARAALASVLTDAGRIEEALAVYREVASAGTGSPAEKAAHLALGRLERRRLRYGDAGSHLEMALPDPAAREEIEALRAELTGGLPDAAAAQVRGALEAIAAAPESDVGAEVDLVRGTGPAAASILDEFSSGVLPAATRLHIVTILSGWPRDDAEPRLAPFLGDPDPVVARAAVEGLAGCGLTAGDFDLLLAGHPGDVTFAREECLRRFGGDPGLREVAPLLGSEDYQTRMEAAHRLSSMRGEGVLEALSSLAKDVSPPVRRAAAAALGEHPGALPGETLRGMIDDETPTVRLEVFRSLSRVGLRAVVRDRGLLDPDPRVRVAVAELLMVDPEEEDLAKAVGMLGDPDGSVQTAIESSLRRYGGGGLAPHLASALRQAEAPGLAMRLVRVMSHLAGEDLGYDPGGDRASREITADRFLERMATR